MRKYVRVNLASIKLVFALYYGQLLIVWIVSLSLAAGQIALLLAGLPLPMWLSLTIVISITALPVLVTAYFIAVYRGMKHALPPANQSIELDKKTEDERFFSDFTQTSSIEPLKKYKTLVKKQKKKN